VAATFVALLTARLVGGAIEKATAIGVTGAVFDPPLHPETNTRATRKKRSSVFT
jgi:hypothetical protein